MSSQLYVWRPNGARFLCESPAGLLVVACVCVSVFCLASCFYFLVASFLEGPQIKLQIHVQVQVKYFVSSFLQLLS